MYGYFKIIVSNGTNRILNKGIREEKLKSSINIEIKININKKIYLNLKFLSNSKNIFFIRN